METQTRLNLCFRCLSPTDGGRCPFGCHDRIARCSDCGQTELELWPMGWQGCRKGCGNRLCLTCNWAHEGDAEDICSDCLGLELPRCEAPGCKHVGLTGCDACDGIRCREHTHPMEIGTFCCRCIGTGEWC